jgi:type VI secretion system ImpM family protein
LFGKLPAHGDFVSRGADRAFVDALDVWLAEEMRLAAGQFPEDFDERYRQAPAWAFVDLDPDGAWSGGALCASVDRAGRKFPLVLAMPADGPDEARQLAGGCLDTICLAFGENCDADALHAAPVAAAELPWEPAGSAWALLDGDGAAVELAGRFPRGIIAAMSKVALP